MRFGITSISGLVVGLLSPFAAFTRTPTLMAIGSTLFLGTLVFIFATLTAMQSPPVYSPGELPRSSTSRSDAPQMEPSMRNMLQDIYGDAP